MPKEARSGNICLLVCMGKWKIMLLTRMHALSHKTNRTFFPMHTYYHIHKVKSNHHLYFQHFYLFQYFRFYIILTTFYSNLTLILFVNKFHLRINKKGNMIFYNFIVKERVWPQSTVEAKERMQMMWEWLKIWQQNATNKDYETKNLNNLLLSLIYH